MANQDRRDGQWRSKARRAPTGSGRGKWSPPLPEVLEARRLLAVVINEFGGPNTVTNPAAIALGSDGNLWFAESSPTAGAIGRIAPSGTIANFTQGLASGATPTGIASGPDGALWFTDPANDMIGRIGTTGTIAEYRVKTPKAAPNQIAPGPDGALWFTETDADQIGRIDTTGHVTEFPIPTPGSQPVGITLGPDGNLWFAESAADQVGRITTSGQVTQFPVPTAGSQPVGITLGPDGNLWFTEQAADQVGRITPQGAVTEFSKGITANAKPSGITSGPDGRLWFTESNAGKVGAISTGGAVAEYTNPATGPSAGLLGIATGADGNLWFTESVGNHVDRISVTGTVAQFPPAVTIATSSFPFEITSGPDDALWFTEDSANKIGRIGTSGAITEYSAGITSTSGLYSIAEGPAAGGTPRLFFTEGNANRIGAITTAGVVSEYPIPVPSGFPTGITLGPDQDLWFAEGVSAGGSGPPVPPMILSVSPTGSLVDEYTLPAQYAGFLLNQITTGPDGALWFTMNSNAGGDIGRVTTAGQFSFYAIPNGPNGSPRSDPIGIVAGANRSNDLWFADSGNHAIGEITTAGAITEYTQGLSSSDVPSRITAGPDGNYWFTDPNDIPDPIGRITPQGVITIYRTPTPSAGTLGIALGPDDDIWFAESSSDRIGQAVLPQGINNPLGRPASVTATVPASFEIATFAGRSTATNATNYTATIDYGDGTTGPGSIIPDPSVPGGFEVIGSHTYATPGSFTARVAIGTGTGSLPPVLAAITASSTLVLTGEAVDGIAGRRSNTLVATFTDLDPNAFAGDFLATVAWADGTRSTAFVHETGTSEGASDFAIYAGHAFAGPGSFVNVVTLVDTSNGLTAGTTSTATVAPTPTFTPFNEIGPDALTPGAGPDGIAEGPDGALWFTEANADRIGRLDPSGNVSEYPLPTADSQPTGITLGPDGALWFTEMAAGQLGRITASGQVGEFSSGLIAGSEPGSIVTGPDGALWFTQLATDQIGRFDPITSQFAEFAVPSTPGFRPDSIADGPDGALWFVGTGSNLVGRVTLRGVITLHSGASGTGSTSITKGPDGNLWFTETGVDKVGKINPTTFQVAEYVDPNLRTPAAITSGPDGDLYVTDASPSPQVVQVTTSGAFASLDVGLTANSQPAGITAGPDGNVYFTEAAGDRIGQLVLPQSSLTSLSGRQINPVQGQTFIGTLATFTEASPVPTTANFQAIINWGDGSPSVVVATVESNGVFSVPGTHTYPEFGPYAVTITVFNASGSRSTQIVAYVRSAIAVTGLPIDVPARRTFTLPVATFTDAGGPRPPRDYILTIDWGDGSTTPGTLGTGPDGQLEVIGTHEYATPGSRPINVFVAVAGDPGLVGSSMSIATVGAPILAASPVDIDATAGTLFQGAVADVTDSSPPGVAGSAYEAAINWGDGTPLSGGTIVVTGRSSFEVIGSHVYAGPGLFPLGVVVAKPSTGDSASAAGTARVSAASPPAFVVTTTNDSGPGSLRQVILDADAVGGHAITFAIPSPGVATIGIGSPLPAITGPTVIDGATQATFEGVTATHSLVEVDGRGAGSSGVNGLIFAGQSAGSLLFGVSIFGFTGAQVLIAAPNIRLFGNELGVRADGTVPTPIGGGSPTPSPSNSGVHVIGPGAVIGGPYADQGNVISGNIGWGIVIDGAMAGFTQVVGNLVGLDPTGAAARPNRLDGVALVNGANHEFVGPGDTISGNAGNGVRVLGGSGDLIIGDTIGTDAGGDRAIGNGDYGVDIDQGSRTILIGGADPLSSNLISGNGAVGVGILGGSTGIVLEASRIGTDGLGGRAIGNGIAGVLISDSPGNVVGPGNLVSGNGTASPGAGIWVDGPGSQSNLISGNKVGTDFAGQVAIPNSPIGILINQASGNEVGGGTFGSGNLVSGNTSVGVMIAGPGASRNLVAGNLIGTNARGSARVGNGSGSQGAGVYVDNASDNAIGGLGGPGNLISGNNYDGVQVFGPASSGTLIEGNGVGTDLSGTARLGNGQDGLLINGAPGTRIIGNLVAANALDGITASGPGASGTLIQGNTIGRGVGGQPLGNGTFGILVINGAPSPTLVNNVNVANTDGPIRDTSLAAPAATKTATTPATSAKSGTKAKKVAVIHGKAKPSNPRPIQPRAKGPAAKSKAHPKKK